MPPRPLPPVNSIQQACREVRDQSGGSPATQFIRLTQDCNAPNLVEIFTNLIMSSQAREYVAADIPRGALLTIEDFVRHHGHEWGFNQTTIQMANANAEYYDIVAALGHPRYAAP
jgi:hypothetical protein